MVLVGLVYPAWLLAGAADYLCHRKSDIEHTSGHTESWYHVLQFFSLLAALLCAAGLRPSLLVFLLIVGLVSSHSILAFLDVSYTDGKRRISPLGQTVHGYMEVLPWVAVMLFGMLNWEWIRNGRPQFHLQWELGSYEVALVFSYILLAGAPILEEFLRTSRLRTSNLG